MTRPLAAWAATPLAVGALALLNSLVGLAWDIAYHIDHGRDSQLFTTPHLMTLTGLAGFGFAGTLAVVLALRAGKPIPRAAPVIIALSAVSTIGFPLDDVWHRVYGVDVTLWSPTHLVMIGGAILSTFAFALLAAEGAGGRLPGGWLGTVVMAGPLLGFSVLQFEFDYGVPQWQALLHPVLVAATAGACLVAARLALGPWAALRVAAVGLGFRALLALFIVAVGHTVPAAPLYLGSAVLVELAFWRGARRNAGAVALVAGLLVGTAGTATEWAWSQVVAPIPWHASLLPRAWVAVAAAMGAAVVGAGAGAVLGARPAPAAWLLSAAGLVLAAGLALPLPRTGVAATATVRTEPAGTGHTAVDRFGRPGTVQPVDVEVVLDPDVGVGADWVVAMAWQGGGREVVPLAAEGGGRYRSVRPIDTGAGWKTMVYVARGPVLAAAPVAIPSDLEYGTPGTPLVPERSSRLVAAGDLLMSEAHPASSWVAPVSYGALWVTTAFWLVLLLTAYRSVASRRPAALVTAARAPAIEG